MEYGAIDLHSRKSLIRIVDETGTIVTERTITTSREALTRVWETRARMRILVESGTESEWVAQVLEGLGHDAIVVDPNYALMYGVAVRSVKTDHRDVAALAEACRLGIFRRAHRVSLPQQAVRCELRIREQLVRQRTQLINLLRAQLRQQGFRLPSGASHTAVARCERLELPIALRTTLTPVLAMLTALGETLVTLDAAAADRAAADPVVQRLMTVPGVGPIVGLTYRATLDDVTRFADARQCAAYLGLVPREYSSGGRQRKGAITKAGPTALRALLVQAAWTLWRQRRHRGALHAWVEALANRRGRRIAVVALARRLGRLLYAMWRDGTDYRPGPVSLAA